MNSNKDELQLIISKSKEELNKIKRAEYLIKNKDKIALQKKLRHQVNADDLKRRNKGYYEKNKKYVHDKLTSKIECSCGQIISLGYKRQHLRTKRHFQNFNDLVYGFHPDECPLSDEQKKSFYQEIKNQIEKRNQIKNQIAGS